MRSQIAGKETSTDLFVSWKNWADAAGEPPGTQRRFSQKLEDRGFEKSRTGMEDPSSACALEQGVIRDCDACDACSTYPRHARAHTVHMHLCVTSVTRPENAGRDQIMARATSARTDGGSGAVVSLHGAGRVQRRIWRAFMTHPDAELTTAALIAWEYPRWTGEPSHKQRIAIVRAAQRVAERVRRDRPGGVVFRALGSNAVANTGSSAGNCEFAQ